MVEKAGPVKPFVEEVVSQGSWRSDPDKAGGSMFVDVGTHHVDLML